MRNATDNPGLRTGISSTLRGIVAVAAGYALLVSLTTLVQEAWLGGVRWQTSDTATLVLAGVFTPLAAVPAGYVAALIARRRLVLHALPICAGIAVETTLLYRSGRVDGPLWFEALAGATLIGGVALGFLLRHLQR